MGTVNKKNMVVLPSSLKNSRKEASIKNRDHSVYFEKDDENNNSDFYAEEDPV